MTKYLITGFSGFVSRHFLDLLESEKEKVSILGLDLNEPDFDYKSFTYLNCRFRTLDLLHKEEVDNVLFQFQPTHVLHLASYSSVAFSWKNPAASFANNTNIFLNLVEQIRQMGIKCRILSIGSSEEYGNVDIKDLPLTEETDLFPVSPYAVARVSQEMLSKVYVDGYDMDIVLTRSFNHLGPYQKEIFVVSSFAKQLCQLKASHGPLEMKTGDLTIIRDFVDVRDVVRAYLLLLRKGQKGQIYNICSGTGTTLKSLIDKICDVLDIQVACTTDPLLVRPSDNRIIIGSNSKIKNHTGWEPTISISQSLQDLVDYWKDRV
jgi:GDP-4-dehydro-6-deoxy-D-mannose reductase